MFLNKKIALFSFLLLSLCWSCSHDTEPFDGPSLVDRFGPFNVVTDLAVSENTVDFAEGETVFFTAQFNKNINWVLTITGTESGSVKIIEGFSKDVDASNATWDGGTTNLPLFRAENCTAVLTIAEEGYTSNTVDITTMSTRSYEGVLFTDFESGQDPSNWIYGNYEFEFTANTGIRSASSEIPAAQDNSYLYMAGTDFEGGGPTDNFFVGLIDIKNSLNGGGYIQFPTTVPEDLYINCFIYSAGDPYTFFQIGLFEDANGTEALEEGQDTPIVLGGDMYTNTWEGWKLFSISAAEAQITQEQLGRMVGFRFLLLSDNNVQTAPRTMVQTGFDYVIFTQGGPLEL